MSCKLFLVPLGLFVSIVSAGCNNRNESDDLRALAENSSQQPATPEPEPKPEPTVPATKEGEPEKSEAIPQFNYRPKSRPVVGDTKGIPVEQEPEDDGEPIEPAPKPRGAKPEPGNVDPTRIPNPMVPGGSPDGLVMPELPDDPDKPYEWPKDIEGKKIEEWIKMTQDPDPAVRQSSVAVLPQFGPDGRKPALQTLAKLATDPDPGVRSFAFDAIAAMSYEDREDQARLFDAIRLALTKSSSGSATRYYGVKALAVYAQEAAPLLPVLDQMKNDAWWETRKMVAFSLGRVGAPLYDDPPSIDPATRRPVPQKPANEAAMKILRQMLENDRSAAVRLETVYSLIGVGPPNPSNPAEYANEVAPWVSMVENQLKREKDKSVQIWLYVLKMMYDDRSIDDGIVKISDYLEEPEFVVRGQALNALATMGPRAISVLPKIRDCLDFYEEPFLLGAALGCLAALGPDAEVAIPDVERFKEKTENKDLKFLADEAIEALKQRRKPAGLPEVIDGEDKKKEMPKGKDEKGEEPNIFLNPKEEKDKEKEPEEPNIFLNPKKEKGAEEEEPNIFANPKPKK